MVAIQKCKSVDTQKVTLFLRIEGYSNIFNILGGTAVCQLNDDYFSFSLKKFCENREIGTINKLHTCATSLFENFNVTYLDNGLLYIHHLISYFLKFDLFRGAHYLYN